MREISLFFAAALLGAVQLSAGCGPAHVALDPDASDKRYLLGADYLNKNLIQPAMVELLAAIKLNPDNADAHHALGLVYLRKASETEELATRANCLRGQNLFLEKQEIDKNFTLAESEFKEAVRARTDFSEAYNSLAVVAQHFGKFDEAIDFTNKALGNIVYRDKYAAQGNLGKAYIAKGDYPRAAQALRQALFEQPKFCVGHWQLALVYKAQGELDHAREELELLFADKGCAGLQEAFHLGGLVSLKLGDRARAGELFRTCVQLAPKSCLARECTLVP